MDELFEGLNKLCNLLVVDPDQLIEFWNLVSIGCNRELFCSKAVKFRVMCSGKFQSNDVTNKDPFLSRVLWLT